MPKITKPILPKNLDIIRAKIGAILVDELPNIATLNADLELANIQVDLERFTPINENEYGPNVVVRFTGGTLEGKTAVYQQWKYNFALMVYSSVNETDGDKKAALLTSKVLGIINEIFTFSDYLHLDLPKPMIFRTEVAQIEIMDSQDTQESLNVSVGGLQFSVTAQESPNTIDEIVLQEYYNNVKLFSSNKELEYEWTKTI